MSFEEAVAVFEDPQILFRLDQEHSESEERWQAIGMSGRGRVLFLITVDRLQDVIRIISARKATAQEIRDYVEL